MYRLMTVVDKDGNETPFCSEIKGMQYFVVQEINKKGEVLSKFNVRSLWVIGNSADIENFNQFGKEMFPVDSEKAKQFYDDVQNKNNELRKILIKMHNEINTVLSNAQHMPHGSFEDSSLEKAMEQLLYMMSEVYKLKDMIESFMLMLGDRKYQLYGDIE